MTKFVLKKARIERASLGRPEADSEVDVGQYCEDSAFDDKPRNLRQVLADDVGCTLIAVCERGL